MMVVTPSSKNLPDHEVYFLLKTCYRASVALRLDLKSSLPSLDHTFARRYLQRNSIDLNLRASGLSYSQMLPSQQLSCFEQVDLHALSPRL